MATMLDSVNPYAIPAETAIVAGYVDGLYAWSPAGWARFSGQKVSVTVKGAAGARVCDVESGDLSPSQGLAWAQEELGAGRRPTIYVSRSEWPQVAGHAGVDYWVADWTGKAHLVPGSVATQWSPGGLYDTSETDGVWPGLPPATPPVVPVPGAPVHYPGDAMQATPINVLIAGGKGWYPLPVSAAKVVNVEFLAPNPDVSGGYVTTPELTNLATEAGPHSPLGAASFAGPNGTWGAVIWSVD